MNYTSVILTSMIVQMKQTFSRNMFKFTLIFGPLLTTIVLGEMYRNSTQDSFIAYVVLGAGLWNLWSCIAFSSAGDINRERYSNTLSIIFTSPTDFRLILLGKIFGNTVLALGSFFLSIFFATIIYRNPLYVGNWSLLIIAFLSTIIAFIIMSLFVAYLLTLSRKTTLYMNCLEIPFALLWGFVFPIENLPRFIQLFSYIFPPTWAVRLLRIAIIEGSTQQFLLNLLPLLATTILFTILSIVLYKIIFRQTKILGTLEMA